MEVAIEAADVSEAEQLIKLQYLCYQPQVYSPVPRVALYYGFVGWEIHVLDALAHRAPKPPNRTSPPSNNEPYHVPIG
jgi:hypothetical protein